LEVVHDVSVQKTAQWNSNMKYLLPQYQQTAG